MQSEQGSPNLTQKCSTMNPGNPKGQGNESQTIVGVVFYTLVSAGFFLFLVCDDMQIGLLHNYAFVHLCVSVTVMHGVRTKISL